MKLTTHVLGYPRIGAQRELKKVVEAYWAGAISRQALEESSRAIRALHWLDQAEAGLDLVTVGDFAYYDQVLNLSLTFGVIPPRFQAPGVKADLDTYFRMARGRAPTGVPAAACEMTKWFDTNYHYIVPEFQPEQQFTLDAARILGEVSEAAVLGHRVKVAIVGPLSFLRLGKAQGTFDRLSLLPNLTKCYVALLSALKAAGVEWVQLDEPVLTQDLPEAWKAAYQTTYAALKEANIKTLATVYFGHLLENVEVLVNLPVDGVHVDVVRGDVNEIEAIASKFSEPAHAHKILSVGVINGRNIWRVDAAKASQQVASIVSKLGERVWVSSSCSLLHAPHSLKSETKLDAELKSWLSFAGEKLHEITLVAASATNSLTEVQQQQWEANQEAVRSRSVSTRITKADVQTRMKTIDNAALYERASPYPQRIKLQQEILNLPLFPTTTIGSFPQTTEIRAARAQFKKQLLSEADYTAAMKREIEYCVREQEKLDIDVLVHGEAERNDMVEYFGEQLEGYAFTGFGWVQSYGSRCVKPAIIYGDICRPVAMTVAWSSYAQSLTKRPMKAMLTGPVTCLQWSFVRDDQPRSATCNQLALALRDEVDDLQKAGISVIQIDEPALREGLPLRKDEWDSYLHWAVNAFKLTAAVADDTTQVHTHMCYSEFNDIIKSIADLDADVITIETSRSNMELLDVFERFQYPNEIGPGVYDIHSPNIPTVDWMVKLMDKAAEKIPARQLWVNPDCGLKTRKWDEVIPALTAMVQAARVLRDKHAVKN